MFFLLVDYKLFLAVNQTSAKYCHVVPVRWIRTLSQREFFFDFAI